MGAHSFGKAERLTSKKSIQELFTRGSSFYSYPFKVLVLNNGEGTSQNQLLVSVSKRNFKKAVDRNVIKRRTREGYRLQKDQLVIEGTVRIGLLYTAKNILPTGEIHKGVLGALRKINTQTPSDSLSLSPNPNP